jgi:hypothetical protein
MKGFLDIEWTSCGALTDRCKALYPSSSKEGIKILNAYNYIHLPTIKKVG